MKPLPPLRPSFRGTAGAHISLLVSGEPAVCMVLVFVSLCPLEVYGLGSLLEMVGASEFLLVAVAGKEEVASRARFLWHGAERLISHRASGLLTMY